MTYEALPPTGAPPANHRTDESDRGLAVLNYIFLLVGHFTFHILPVVAVILAYVRRPGAPPFEAGHYRAQIRIFWWSFGLAVAALALVLLALGSGFGWIVTGGWADAWAFHWGTATVLAIIAAGLCGFASFLIAVIGALVGLIKLLSNEPARRA